jgi:hypothetical protein
VNEVNCQSFCQSSPISKVKEKLSCKGAPNVENETGLVKLQDNPGKPIKV